MANILLSGTLRNNLLNAFTGRGGSSVAVGNGTCYLALSSTAPSYNSSGEITNITEPTDTNYARVMIGTSNTSVTYKFDPASNGSITNKDEIHFNTASGAWSGTIGYWAIYSASTGGSPILAGAFESAVTVTSDKIVCIKKHQMSMTLMPNT